MTKVNRSQFLQALELVSPGLSTRDLIEDSNSYAFRDKMVFTYDDEVAAVMPSPIDIVGAIPSDPLRGILNKLKDDVLEISQTNGSLDIICKGQSASIAMSEKIGLPIENLEPPKKWKKLPEKFSEAIGLVESCASKDESRFELTCVHFHPEWIEAYDTTQFARYRMELPIRKEFVLRQVSVRHLTNMEMTEISETDQWVHFRNSAGLVLSCRRYSDSYPSLSTADSIAGTKIQLPKGLFDTSERAEIFSTGNDVESNIELIFKPGWIVVIGQGPFGKYRGRRKIKYKGEEMHFLVHPKMFGEIIKRHNELELCTGNNPALKAEIGDFKFLTSLAIPKAPEPSKSPKATKSAKKGK